MDHIASTCTSGKARSTSSPKAARWPSGAHTREPREVGEPLLGRPV